MGACGWPSSHSLGIVCSSLSLPPSPFHPALVSCPLRQPQIFLSSFNKTLGQIQNSSAISCLWANSAKVALDAARAAKAGSTVAGKEASCNDSKNLKLLCNSNNSSLKIDEVNDISCTFETHQRTSLVDLLKVCKEWGLLQEAKSIHGYVLKSKFSDQDCLVLSNHVMHVYSNCMDYDAARKVFDGMSKRNVFSWTVMIVASNEHGYYFDGIVLFSMMLEQGVLPDGFAFSAVSQSCTGLGFIELVEMVHAHVVIRGFLTHTVVSTSLLNSYAKLGKIESSSKVFQTMAELNVVTWNAMISGYTSNGMHAEAFDCFTDMVDSRITPNNLTFISVSKAVGQLGDVTKCHEIHRFASKWGLDSTTVVGTALIDMYAKCGSLTDAQFLFDSKFRFCQISTPWNAMLAGYSQSGSHHEALDLFTRMRQNDVKSDIYTFCSVFNSIVALKDMKFLRETHAVAWKSGHDVMKISTLNALTDAYAKCESLEVVETLFDRMEEKDIVSWTTLVTAYCQFSEWEKALIIFSQMRREGYVPNDFTFSIVITACAGICLLEFGQQIHGLICKASLVIEACIESALIDMYAKCGNLVDAKKVFERVSNPDTVTWTAIISAYAQHGLVKGALQFFRKMVQCGAKPNAVTLLCVIFACSHGGMVEEGLNFFHQMEEIYGVVPEMEHYACVVDLLGRVGQLNEAMEFIGMMPIKPNEMIWQTLLGACRVHRNAELGGIAAQNILSTKPVYPAAYVFLSNTYMESGLYEDGVSLRHVMKERGVKKEPGYSWIFVRGMVHKFHAGDEQHPRKDEICAMLDKLMTNIKSIHFEMDFSLLS
ncbi:putative pentatricopeptide repeat-containing protein At1g56570 [Prosopis cineraria]|uniref:putative pentatricopeptide repeat-containing protein At1g56570 n=1 Tax=Prosopis cineraria TaxID=364024 RepID=UPI00240EB572|nr:putative pentatricopeptide repeat-containing protein At1g56570 [Prosopis cineraria]XP_054815680.1 putative pentatricopeptide repeat-containing protein At1g56570 [Prosopis cineraria]